MEKNGSKKWEEGRGIKEIDGFGRQGVLSNKILWVGRGDLLKKD